MLYDSTRLTIIPDGMVTLEANSTFLGYSLKDSYKTALVSYYRENPFVVPTEYIDIREFSTGPTESGLSCSTTLTVNNVHELIVLIRRGPNDYTCFMNPNYNNFFVTLGSRNFPDKPISTTSIAHYRMKLETDSLDTIICPTQSYENSQLKSVCAKAPFRMRCGEDDTDNMINFATSKLSNCYTSDSPKTMNVSFQIAGSPQVAGFPGDVLKYTNKEDDTDVRPDTTNRIPPLYATVSYAYFLFHLGGSGSLTEAQRVIYKKDVEFNEVFAQHFPEGFARLAASTASNLIA
jgi:hypothetical protein